jgi:hypothetical protein
MEAIESLDDDESAEVSAVHAVDPADSAVAVAGAASQPELLNT